MSGAYSAEKVGSLASAWSISVHKGVELGMSLGNSSSSGISSELRLLSLSVVACRTFCIAVTGVS